MFHKGRKVKKSKKKKIISLIVVVAVAGTSGAVVYRKVRRPVAAATEVSKVQTAEVKKGNISIRSQELEIWSWMMQRRCRSHQD